MAVEDAVGIFDANMPLTLRCERYDNYGQVKVVKWSNSGKSLNFLTALKFSQTTIII